MKIHETGFDDLYVFEPKVFGDQRGYFLESYRASVFEDLNLNPTFVQDNESNSHSGIIRGLHFQQPPHAQDKLLRVVSGSIFDVVVDLRKSSATFGKSFGVELSGENKKSIFVPKGFAHGFACLQDNSIVQYKCTDYYHPELEDGLMWNDPELQVSWPIENPTLSDKDLVYKPFREFVTPYV